jgi:hypothetical protein
MSAKLLSTAAAAGLLTTALAVTAAPAQARSCLQVNHLSLLGSTVSATRTLVCNPGADDNPLPTTIQREVGTTWVTVTATGDGYAAYPCAGSAQRTYRLKEATYRQITVLCS